MQIQKTLRYFRLDSLSLRKQIQFALDLVVLISAFLLAYLLRFDFLIPTNYVHQLLFQMPYVVLLQLVMLILEGVYTFVWRYTGLTEVRAFAKAAFCAALPQIALRVVLPEYFHVWKVPFSIIFFDTICAFGGVVGLRSLRRALYENTRKSITTVDQKSNKRAVLLIGAGRAGVLAAKEIQNRGDSDLEIKGFIDDDPMKQRSIIGGVRIVGGMKDLSRLVKELRIDHVIITIAEASRDEMRRIIEACEQIPVRVRIIPGLYEILHGNVEVSRIRDVRVDDLLGREPVQLNEESLGLFLTGKTVMVTGAGGSIGTELAHQVARFEPTRLILVERAENALFQVDCGLRKRYPNQLAESLIGDICDAERMRTIFHKYRPEVILHAAAHKHVPLMEFNSSEAVKNNILATHLLGTIAGESKAEVFVLISTDKAVRPTSVMGATKRAAELVIQDLNRQFETKYVAVRFGNVIGSTGSVIPLFLESIRNGEPIKITDRRMKRYFITIREAAQLVLQAGAMAKFRNGGEIFVLQMGEPVNILDLAEAVITLSGLKPHRDIQVVETGLRPGEKLHEELLLTEECVNGTVHPKIFVSEITNGAGTDLHLALARLRVVSQNGHEKELRECLADLLPEATLISTLENLQPHEEDDTALVDNQKSVDMSYSAAS